MAQFKDGIVWFKDLDELRTQEDNLKVGALVFQVDPSVDTFEIRQQLTFAVMAEGWRCEPLYGDVIQAQANTIALHLHGNSISSLHQLIAQMTKSKTATFPAVDESKPPVVIAGTNEYGTLPKLTEKNAETPAVQPEISPKIIAGRLAGKISLGVLRDLLDTRPVNAPPDPASLINVFRYLHQKKASGTLVVRNPDFTKTIWIKTGLPLKVTVSPVKEDEMLGQLLIKAKWLNPHLVGQALKWARADKVGLGTALVRANLLDANKLNRTLAHQTYRRLQDLFAWSDAEFTFTPSTELPGKPYHPVAIPRLMNEVTQDLLRQGKSEQLNILLAYYDDYYATIDGIDENVLKHLVDEKTLGVCKKIFDGTRSIRDAITASLLGRPKTVRLVLYLIAADAIRLDREPIGKSVDTALLLNERLRTLETQDYFQRLNLFYSTHPDDIAPAHVDRVAQFKVGTPFYNTDAVVSEKITRLLDEASMVLSTPVSRRKYRSKLLGNDNVEFLKAMVRNEADLAEIHGQHERARRLRDALTDLHYVPTGSHKIV